MNDSVYLDNSATTKPCGEALRFMNDALVNNWGNPSSLHTMGIDAEGIIEACKETCAKMLGARSDEIFFTSGGTEANNIAVFGAATARAKRGNRIVTTEIEHPSVFEAISELQNKGFEVIRLKPDKFGHISPSDIRSAINQNTVLVSIMLVNNETGAVQPVEEAAKAIKEVNAPALLHCDAVQAFGKMPIKVTELGVDLLSFSGHKIHAPKGIGVLYKKKNVHITPLTHGGGQQSKLRPGTEPVPLIAALSGAISALPPIMDETQKMYALRNYTVKKLEATGLVTFNSPTDAIPYIINISVEGYKSETLLHFLDSKGIFVSSGSACSKGELSRTLTAQGLNKSQTDSALRISFSRYNTEQDADKLCAAICEAAKKLKRI